MLAKISIEIVAIIGMTLGALFLFQAVGPWIEAQTIPMFGSRIYDTALFGAAGLLWVFITLRLIQGKVWAWWTTLWANILALGLGLSIFYSALHPHDDFARSESGFGIGISIILMTPAIVACVLLSLPPVRRRFVSSKSNRSRV